MADALDSKSSELRLVWVQLPPPVLFMKQGLTASGRESFFRVWGAFDKRQDFSHRAADAKSLLDEVLRRGREERAGAGWKGEYGRGGRSEWGGGMEEGIARHARSMKRAAPASVAERG